MTDEFIGGIRNRAQAVLLALAEDTEVDSNLRGQAAETILIDEREHQALSIDADKEAIESSLKNARESAMDLMSEVERLRSNAAE